ncbi:unnamed protein product [Mycena citricolor]|uniref:non-reducing end alpha-L-arabinofuranosidase n=1 Tax=Mycena citricolor TaxID=2018698 RepID=A0AAD2HA33_9AGAR|nr:unnamed protein product [Mycena citricolor]
MFDALLLSLAALPAALGAVTTVSVSATASHPIPTTLFADTTAALNAWVPVGASATISVIADPTPLSSALPNSLVLTTPPNAGAQGFSNTGFWGMKFEKGLKYTASLYYRIPTLSARPAASTLTLALRAADGSVLASANVKMTATTWTQVSVVLSPTKTPPSTANTFTVTTDGGPAGIEVHFAMLSLFPPTFKNRPNGMRADIAQTLADIKPAFFRFPGGNNLEGQTPATRWQWNATVGPLINRPGRMGDWSYPNTDGLGIYEFLTWCEDLDMEPFMAVWDGFALGGTSVTGAALDPYIAQAIDQINFVIGDPKTSKPAALRASLGHPAPFKLNYVEIGNEDFIGNAASTVQARWSAFHNNLTATFPQLHFMATSHQNSPVLTPTPEIYDNHVYQTPTWFATNSFMYDNFPRNGMRFFEGEYASTSTNSSNLFGGVSQGRLTFPTVSASVGEAAFMTGFERKLLRWRSSSMQLTAFRKRGYRIQRIIRSPSRTRERVPMDAQLGWIRVTTAFRSVQHLSLIISFHSAGSVYKSSSYYVQQLFSLNKGDEYLPSTLPDSSTSATLLWSVTRRNATSGTEVIIKISNRATTAQAMQFVLPFSGAASKSTAQVISGNGGDSNTPEHPNLIAPVTVTVATGSTFNYTAPAVSVTVLVVGVTGA